MAKNNDIIARNIDSNYDLALEMSNLSSEIAQQAVVQKMLTDQEEMIANSPEVYAAQQAVSEDNTFDIEAVKKTAAEMAETFVKEQGESGQQTNDATIKAANSAIVSFATQMEASNDDIASQLQTYNKLIKDTGNSLIKDSARAAYSTFDILNQAMGETAEEVKKSSEALGNLSKAGVLSTDSLMGMIEALDDVDSGDDAQIDKAVDAFKGEITGKDATGKKSKDVNLDELRDELGLDSSATINDIKEAYIKANAKYNDDGTLKYDKNGNIAMKGNNKNKNAVYNALNDLSAELGDYADYTEEQLKALQKHSITVDVPSVVNSFLDSVNSLMETEIAAIKAAEGNVDISYEDLKNNAEFQAKASQHVMEQGYAMINNSTKDLQTAISDTASELERMKNDGSYSQEQINAKATELSLLQENYNESVAKLHNATMKAAGYLSSLEADELLTRALSTKEKISGLYDKIGSGESLGEEDFQLIRDELAPQLYDLYGEDFDINQFYQDLQNGSDTAFKQLQELYSKQGEITDTEYSKSIGAKEKDLDILTNTENMSKEDLDQYDEIFGKY